jgi:hypothetical protein
MLIRVNPRQGVEIYEDRNKDKNSVSRKAAKDAKKIINPVTARS